MPPNNSPASGWEPIAKDAGGREAFCGNPIS